MSNYQRDPEGNYLMNCCQTPSTEQLFPRSQQASIHIGDVRRTIQCTSSIYLYGIYIYTRYVYIYIHMHMHIHINRHIKLLIEINIELFCATVAMLRAARVGRSGRLPRVECPLELWKWCRVWTLGYRGTWGTGLAMLK